MISIPSQFVQEIGILREHQPHVAHSFPLAACESGEGVVRQWQRGLELSSSTALASGGFCEPVGCAVECSFAVSILGGNVSITNFGRRHELHFYKLFLLLANCEVSNLQRAEHTARTTSMSRSAL